MLYVVVAAARHDDVAAMLCRHERAQRYAA